MLVVTFRGPSWTLAELDEEAEHLGWKLIAPKRLTQEPRNDRRPDDRRSA